MSTYKKYLGRAAARRRRLNSLSLSSKLVVLGGCKRDKASTPEETWKQEGCGPAVRNQARQREAALSGREGCGKVKWIPDRKV